MKLGETSRQGTLAVNPQTLKLFNDKVTKYKITSIQEYKNTRLQECNYKVMYKAVKRYNTIQKGGYSTTWHIKLLHILNRAARQQESHVSHFVCTAFSTCYTNDLGPRGMVGYRLTKKSEQ